MKLVHPETVREYQTVSVLHHCSSTRKRSVSLKDCFTFIVSSFFANHDKKLLEASARSAYLSYTLKLHPSLEASLVSKDVEY
jgi:hypothetical protein